MLALARIDALEACELAVVVLDHVVPALDRAGVLDLDVLVLRTGGLDQCDLVAIVLDHGRVAPLCGLVELAGQGVARGPARTEEHTSELQSLMRISYAVFCLKKKK